MNATTATRRCCLTHVTAITALLAAALPAQASPDAAAAAKATPTTIVQLPRVVVTGHVVRAAPVVQLPRVVVVGRRGGRAPTELVQAAPEKLAAAPKQGA